MGLILEVQFVVGELIHNDLTRGLINSRYTQGDEV